MRGFTTAAGLPSHQGDAITFQGSPSCEPTMKLEDLARMTPCDLERLFAESGPGATPTGAVRGMLLMQPGKRVAVPLSRGSRVVWQGKVFHPELGMTVNKFFGLPMIWARVTHEPSWRDGAACLVLDYTQTSFVYQNIRDEVREVAPGLYLGLMFEIQPTPRLQRYFAFEDRH